MTIWRKDQQGHWEPAMPSDYVFGDMDGELAYAILGRLIDVLWVDGKLSDDEVIEILALPGLVARKVKP